MRVATKEDFERLVALMAGFARDQYKQTAEIAPALFVVNFLEGGTEDEVEVGVMPVGALQTGKNSKTVLAEFMQYASTQPGVLLVGHLTEGWMVLADGPGHEQPSGPLSQHPDRQEVLMFNILSADCQALKRCVLQRNGDSVFFDETSELQFVNTAGANFKGVFARSRPASH